LRRALVGPADHLVADLKARDLVADPGYPPGQVAALPGRKRRRRALVHRTLADRDLARIDRARNHLHEHPPAVGGGARNIHDVEDLHRPVVVEAHCS